MCSVERHRCVGHDFSRGLNGTMSCGCTSRLRETTLQPRHSFTVPPFLSCPLQGGYTVWGLLRGGASGTKSALFYATLVRLPIAQRASLSLPRPLLLHTCPRS